MIHLSEKGADYLHRVSAIAPMIDAAMDEIDATRDLPPALFSALRDKGLFRLVQPIEYGGAELDPPSLVQVIEAIARHDASTAWCVGQTNICAVTAAFLEPSVVRDIFSPDTASSPGVPVPAKPEPSPAVSGSPAPSISPAAAASPPGSARMSR